MRIQNLDNTDSVMDSLFFTQNVDYSINNLNVNDQAQLNQYFQVYDPIINNSANPLTSATYSSTSTNYIDLSNSLTIIDTTSGAVAATVPAGQTNQMLTISLVNGASNVTLTVQNCFYANTAHYSDMSVPVTIKLTTTPAYVTTPGQITLTPASPTVTLLNSMSVTGSIPQPNGLWVVISGAKFQ
jgi:hypothetical protein